MTLKAWSRHVVDIDAHNEYQRRYFEGPPKKTMIPRATPYLERHISEALRFANVGLTDRVLEVGCGMGRYTLAIARRGVHVEGLDLSPVLLQRLREYGGESLRIPLHCADVLDPPRHLDAAFDVVLGFFVLHHLHDLPACFAPLARLLKPRGRMIFVEPNPFNPLYYVQIAITPRMTWKAERGLLRMRRHFICSCYEQAGLGRCDLARFGFFPPFLANRRWGAAIEARLERIPFLRGALPFQLFKAERL